MVQPAGQEHESRKIGKRGRQQGLDRNIWKDTWEWAKDVKTFLSYFIVHQRGSTTEEALSNKVDKITQPDDTSQALSSATPVPAQWAYEWSSHGDRNGGYAWAQQYRHPLNKGWCCCYCCQMSSLALTETNTRVPIWHYSLRRWTDHQFTCWSSWLHWATISLKRPEIHAYTRHTFLVWVCLSYLQGFSQHYYPRAYRVFALRAWDPT